MVVINKYIKKITTFNASFLRFIALMFLIVLAAPLHAAVLPDERVDVMEHEYSGGGITVSGPSILVRKNISNAVSVTANYYVDMISSASIDVLAQASKYSEERNQKSIGFDFFHDRTSYNINYITSDENDYQARTYNVGVNQTFFGDLTTVGFGVSLGQDVVGRSIKGEPDPSYKLRKEHRSYSLHFSQILTRDLITDLVFESGTDECIGMKDGESCLNNPYRIVRFKDPNSAKGYGEESEFYPLTRNTDAIGLSAMYHLPYAATLRFDGRTFKDSWDINAQNAGLRYTQNYNDNLLFELRYRWYSQTAANFYSDLFPYKNAQNFKARDRELSSFTSTSYGLGATYTFRWKLPGIDKSTMNIYWDHLNVQYDDFRDYAHFMDNSKNKTVYALGEEPLYVLDAEAFRFYLSFWF